MENQPPSLGRDGLGSAGNVDGWGEHWFVAAEEVTTPGINMPNVSPHSFACCDCKSMAVKSVFFFYLKFTAEREALKGSQVKSQPSSIQRLHMGSLDCHRNSKWLLIQPLCAFKEHQSSPWVSRTGAAASKMAARGTTAQRQQCSSSSSSRLIFL